VAKCGAFGTRANPETKGLFASVGTKKGWEFAPDARMKRILTGAVAIGNAAARADTYYPGGDLKMVYFLRQHADRVGHGLSREECVLHL
jgi:hypothetical protein